MIEGIAQTASDMKTTHLRTEAAMKVLKTSIDVMEQEGAALIKMIDSIMTGVGQNYDMSV